MKKNLQTAKKIYLNYEKLIEHFFFLFIILFNFFQDLLEDYLSFYDAMLAGDIKVDLIKIREDDSLSRHLAQFERVQKEVREMFPDSVMKPGVLIDYPDEV